MTSPQLAAIVEDKDLGQKMAQVRRLPAFTLIELLAVVAIIGILATIAAVGISGATERARDALRQRHLIDLKGALELYNQDEGRFPEATGERVPERELVSNYISKLPSDPRAKSGHTDYRYFTNGRDFALVADLEYDKAKPTLPELGNCREAQDYTKKGTGIASNGTDACFRTTND